MGGGTSTNHVNADDLDLPSTESETETDCDGVLPSLFQPAQSAADDAEEEDSDATEGEFDEEEPAAAAAAAIARTVPSAATYDSIPAGPPQFDLPPVFSGLRFREVSQSVVGCRDLMRVIITCAGEIVPAATATAGKNAALIHRVVEDKGQPDAGVAADSRRDRGRRFAKSAAERQEVVVDSAWVFGCVRGGRLLAV